MPEDPTGAGLMLEDPTKEGLMLELSVGLTLEDLEDDELNGLELDDLLDTLELDLLELDDSESKLDDEEPELCKLETDGPDTGDCIISDGLNSVEKKDDELSFAKLELCGL